MLPSGNPPQAVSKRAVLLHYPFCHFPVWRRKFNILDSSQSADWGFYRESRLAMEQEAAAAGADGEEKGEQKAAAVAAANGLKEGGEDRLAAFFRRRVMLEVMCWRDGVREPERE